MKPDKIAHILWCLSSDIDQLREEDQTELKAHLEDLKSAADNLTELIIKLSPPEPIK